MDFRAIDEDTIEILPGEMGTEKLLEEIARLSYETAASPFPHFIQPIEVPESLVDFKGLVTEDGLRIDYLNGRLCSTRIQRKGNRLFFDARSFKEDRGSPEVFLTLLRERLDTKKPFGRRTDGFAAISS